MPDPAVPAERLAVGRQVDEPVARDALLADRARQLPRSSAVSWKCRLDWRKPSAQRGGIGARPRSSATSRMTARRSRPIRKYQSRRARLGRVGDAHAVVRPPHRDPGVARVVEEHRVAAVRQEQRHAHVRARAVADVRVPELPAGPEPVQLAAALAQAVEVLLAREGEARVDPRAAVRPAAPAPSRRRPARAGASSPRRRGTRGARGVVATSTPRSEVPSRTGSPSWTSTGVAGHVPRDDEGRPGLRRRRPRARRARCGACRT